ncbi:MAG: glycosyltransferase [bacterium]
MRILLATESFHPVVSGVSVVTQRLGAALAERGHEVTIVAPSLDRRFRRETQDGYTVYRLPSRRHPFKKGARFAPFSYRYVKRVLDVTQPQVVHIQEPATLCRPVARQAFRRGIPVIATQHFLFEFLMTFLPLLKSWHPLIQTVTERNILSFYKCCDVVTVPSQTLKRYLEERDITVPVVVISNGVDTTRFAPRQRSTALLRKYRLPNDRPLLGYVGRLDPEKNLEVFLEALALVKDEYDFQAVMVGSGQASRHLQARSRQMGLSPMIRWIRPVANKDKALPQIFNLMDVFCIPSVIETESLVTMEAMSSGLPVLAANEGALPELVTSGKNGYLVSEDTAESWATSLRRMLSNQEAFKAMGEDSRKRIAKRDVVDSVIQFEELYAKVASGADHKAEVT